MAHEAVIIPGIVKGGLVVPQGKVPLPEGASVSILLPVAEVPDQLRAEFDGWERAGDEAWAMIEQWEQGQQP
jgi:hypothetical protein